MKKKRNNIYKGIRAGLLLVLFVILGVENIYADGSKDLYPSGVTGRRAFLRSSNVANDNWPFPNIGTHYVSSNAALSSLWCFNNQLSSLDVSGNQNLTFLDCSGNKLTSLDVSSNTELIRLLCYNNALTALDLSKNDWLNRLWLFGNAFDEKNIDLLIQTLKESSGGELWLSTKTPNREWSDLITAKGWTLK